MFGKLVKHEFKSVGKWYLSLYLILLVLSVGVGFWANRVQSQMENFDYNDGNSWQLTLFAITIFIFATIVASIFISTLVLCVTRFKNHIYGRQGYLTMTLPVTGHQLILSKLLVASVWNVLALVMLLVSALVIGSVYTFGEINGQDIHLGELVHALATYTDWGAFFLHIIGFLISVLAHVLCIYFAISLGQLFRDHRGILAIAFYIGLQVLTSIIVQPFLGLTLFVGPDSTETLFGANPMQMLLNIIFSIGFYFGTHYIMTKKLNLQ